MKKKILSLLLAVLMVVSLLPMSAFAKMEPEQNENYKILPSDRQAAIEANRPAKAGESEGGITVTERDGSALSVKTGLDTAVSADSAFTAYDDADQVRVMVILDGVSLLDSGFTQQELSSELAVYAAEAMVEMQDALVSQIQSVVDEMSFTGRARRSVDTAVTAQYHYTTLLNGVSVQMPYGALETVREMAGVADAFVVPTYSVPEDMTDGTAEPAMAATRENFGSAQTWNAGYTGEGMKIAIIDTGLDADHPSFAADPSSPSVDAGDIEAVLTQLNSYETYSQKSAVALKSSSLYRSAKVAYGFNYVDNNLNITHDKDSMGDHGTHVAGITAANKTEGTEVVGVAPDAQLFIMKVFGVNGGAYWDDIVAALEDAIILGADAVNMSLGSPAGFDQSDESTEEFNQWCNEIYAKVEDCDMILAVAAGNSYSAAYGSPLGTNLDLASNPDNGIVSSPGTYNSATMVASIENESVMYNYITVNGQKVPYTDVAAYNFISTLTEYGQTEYPYVLIDGYGTAEDFAAAGESWNNYGKIAVVSRGSLAFTDKQSNASNAGFSGLIVYNNADDGLMNMQDAEALPNIFVDAEGGAVLKAAADENGEGVLTVESGMTTVKNPAAGQMSDFSSWGVSADLELTPDVTAPGGNIYSTVDKGQYGVMSGTSMATPHIAGMSALVLEYLHKEYPGNSDTWYRTAAEALIMSTAEPVTESTGVLYSPRKQGAGAANVYSAVTSPAYLTVNGTTPKISLGDDDAKTGKYTFTFEINNLTDAAVTYRLDGSAMTDQVEIIDGVKYMGETSRALDAAFAFSVLSVSDPIYDYNGDGVFDLDDVQDLLDDVNYERTVNGKWDLTDDGKIDTADAQALYEILMSKVKANAETAEVPANGRITVGVTLTLSADDKAYMDANYENGIYVDAFVRCYGVEDNGDLSLPVVGFYGDWSAAPAIDDSGWDLYNDSPNRYWNVVWTDTGYTYNLGANPYLTEERDDAHNVLSPNGDGYQDAICDLYLSMLRNAKKLTFTVKDADGNVLNQNTANFVRKSYYNSSYGLCVPYIYSNYETEDFYDFSGASDLDRFTFTIDAYLDDGDDNVDDSVTLPIVIDLEKPECSGFEYNVVDGKRMLSFTASDNYDIAAVFTLTATGDIIETYAVDNKADGVDGESASFTIDVSKYDTNFYVVACDYGFNERYYQISFAGDGSTPNIDGDSFYGYRNISVIPSGGYNYVTTAYNGWYSFTDASDMLMHTDAYYNGESAAQAAEYVDGWIIGIDANGDIFAMEAGSWDRSVFAKMPYANEYAAEPYVAMDMAYDFTTDTMYVITDEEYNGSGAYLWTMDILTGELTQVGMLTGFANKEIKYDWGYTYVQTYGQALTLACDNDGVLYSINHADGDLYTIDPETCEATPVGSTGYEPKYYQSMTVDHATNKLYWSAYQSYTGTSYFYEVDKATGKATDVTSSGIQHNAEMTALFKPNTAYTKDVIPNDAALTGILLSDSSLRLANGNQYALSVTPAPYYAALGEISWSTDDASVATVDENGIVTAVNAGTATITAACGDLTAACTVEVVYVNAKLALHDGNSLTWLSMDAKAPAAAVNANGMEPYETTYNYFISAAYAHGSVYAYDYYGGFYKMDADTLQGVRLGVNTKVNGTSGLMLALTYNYADGFLYGIAQEVVSMWETNFKLVRVNPSNGSYEELCLIDTNEIGYLYNLAVDYNGTFYAVVDGYDSYTYEEATQVLAFTLDEDGSIYDYTKTTLTNFVTNSAAYVSSLVWSEANNGLFWADYYGLLEYIDPTTGENLPLGYIGSTASNSNIMNTCLFEYVENEPSAETVPVETVSMVESYQLLVDSSITVSVAAEPWNATPEFVYEVADSSIASVDLKGNLTGVSVGETTLTVTEKTSGAVLKAAVTVVPSTGKLYGMVVSDLNYGSNYWAAFKDNAPGEAEVSFDFSETSFAPYAGAYYDGYLYTYAHVVDELVDEDGFDYSYKYYLLKVDPVDWTFEVIGDNTRVHETIMDMAFDYETGAMYAVAFNSMSASTLVQINLETAEVTAIGTTGDADLRALTFDENNQLYAISLDGELYKVNKYTAKTTYVGDTGYRNLDGYQSMYYDYETGNTYWSQYGTDGSNGLMLVDLANGTATNLGSITVLGASVACLYSVSDNDPVVEDTVEISGIALPEKNTVVVDETVALNATILPVSVADVEDGIQWTSDNDSVATVDENGVVTGISAGTATITASAGGYEAECVVTVTAEARRFYVYDEDNRQWISFTADDPSDVNVERTDAEDESKIMASLYRDGKLYSFTADGRYWSVDPDTFERTLISEDFVDLSTVVTSYDWWGNAETGYYKLLPLSMTYDEVKDQAYVQMMSYQLFDYGYDFYEFYSMMLIPIDLEKGEVEYETEEGGYWDWDEDWNSFWVEETYKVISGDYYQTDEGFTNAILVDNDMAVFVNTFDSGLVTYWNLKTGEVMEVALVYNYWGNADHGRGMYVDPLTDTLYVVRDMKDWGGYTTLNTMTLSDADLTELGVIGEGYYTVNSLFIK